MQKQVGGEGGNGGEGGGVGGRGGEGGVETGYSSNATTLPSTDGRAGNEMETPMEVKAGRQTSRSVVHGPLPSKLAGAQLAGSGAVGEDGVTVTEVLTRAGLRSLICKQHEEDRTDQRWQRELEKDRAMERWMMMEK
jgi:hypothetical protein